MAVAEKASRNNLPAATAPTWSWVAGLPTRRRARPFSHVPTPQLATEPCAPANAWLVWKSEPIGDRDKQLAREGRIRQEIYGYRKRKSVVGSSSQPLVSHPTSNPRGTARTCPGAGDRQHRWLRSERDASYPVCEVSQCLAPRVRAPHHCEEAKP